MKIDQWTIFIRFLVGLPVVGLMLKGLTLFHLVDGIRDFTHLAPAILLISSTFTFMVWTAQKWAAGLLAITAVSILRIIPALISGRTLGVPRVATPYPLAFELMALFIIITLLTACYASRPPRGLEKVALAFIVVGLLSEMVDEANLIPLVVGTMMLGVARVLHHIDLSRRADRISLASKRGSS